MRFIKARTPDFTTVNPKEKHKIKGNWYLSEYN